MRIVLRTFGAKLMMLSLVTSGLAIIVTCATQLVSQRIQTRDYFVKSLTSAASIVTNNLSGAVSFKDKQATLEILSSLRPSEGFVAARVLDMSKQEIASISADNAHSWEVLLDFDGAWNGVSAKDKLILIRMPIRYGDGETIGELQVASDTTPAELQTRKAALLTLLVGLGAMLISATLSRILQKKISRPVVELRNAASKVTHEQDYSVRAVRQSQDELGELTDTFNTMLNRIELDNRALADANSTLENRVKERTIELESATREAQAASVAKSYFLANMSHEIRTPMTAILGYSETLLDNTISEIERLDCVRTIHRNGEHLLAIINDILDVTKIEAGRMTLEKMRISVIQIVGEVASLCRVKAIEKGLSMSIDFEGLIPESIESDPTRLRQILVNLVNNAIKFTERGEVRVIVSLHQNQDGASSVVFRVRDTGIGMTQQQLGRLFSAFTQADESMSRRFGGTGLGLVISRSLAKMLGGDVTVQSQEGLGSCFTLQVATGSLDGVGMRFGVTEAECLASIQHVDVSNNVATSMKYHLNLRIMLVEDGPDNQRFISALLRKTGAEVTVVENGALAVEQALSALASGRPYDVILMDMQMPVMDGYTATRLLRSRKYSGLIIALTAHAMVEDRQKCEQAGCDDYLTKPVQRLRMLERLAQIKQPGQPGVQPLAVSAPAEVPVSMPIAAAVEEAPASSDAIYSTIELDPDFGDIVVSFARLLEERCSDLQKVVEEKNLERLKVLSHQLKGSAGTYGFNVISQGARLLEDAVKAGNWDQIQEAMINLSQLCGRVRLRSDTAFRGPQPQHNRRAA